MGEGRRIKIQQEGGEIESKNDKPHLYGAAFLQLSEGVSVPALLLPLFLLSLAVFPAQAAESPKLLSRIAFGSCALQYRPQPIWDSVIALKPELFLFLGDVIYADTRDMKLMKAKYDTMAAIPGYQHLLAACPVLAIWDDHDYGENDAGAEYPMRIEAQKIFLDFCSEPVNSDRRKRPGVYAVQYFGPAEKRVQVIMLDVRYFKSPWIKDETKRKRYKPDTDPNSTMLGEAHWKWLKKQLKQRAQVRIIASGIQVINDEHGFECWGNLPRERERLFNLIRDAKAGGVIFLSGDRHFSEISSMDGGVGYPLYDFTSSGLTHSAEMGIKFPNSRRVGNPFGGLSFGTVTIDWGQKEPAIIMKAHDIRGEVQFEHQIRLSELQIK